MSYKSILVAYASRYNLLHTHIHMVYEPIRIARDRYLSHRHGWHPSESPGPNNLHAAALWSPPAFTSQPQGFCKRKCHIYWRPWVLLNHSACVRPSYHLYLVPTFFKCVTSDVSECWVPNPIFRVSAVLSIVPLCAAWRRVGMQKRSQGRSEGMIFLQNGSVGPNQAFVMCFFLSLQSTRTSK